MGSSRIMIGAATIALVVAACGNGDVGGDDAAAPGENGRVVVASWGGEYQDSQREAFWRPFEEETGIEVIEGESPVHSTIKTQVDSGNPEWDVVTTGTSALFELGEDYFEPIDYDAFSDEYAEIPDEHKRTHAVTHAAFCFVAAYLEEEFPDGGPENWVDFWDVERFPGPRGMALDGGVPWNSVEAAWMSAGNDSLENIDLDVVFDQFDKLAPHVGKWWTSGAESMQNLATGEVVMSVTTTGQANTLIDDGIPVGIVWDNAFCGNDNWYILKGSQNLENAQRLIAYMQDAERQAAFVEGFPMAVPNPNAYDIIDPDVGRNLPTHPDNADRVIFDEELRSTFWGENREEIVERFEEWRIARGQD